MAILTSHPQPIAVSDNQPSDNQASGKRPNFLNPLRRWINRIQITNRRTAYLVCRAIPSHCPFERDISLLGSTIHIPALCRINPVYDEIVSLRLRALTYLIDICGEEVDHYVR